LKEKVDGQQITEAAPSHKISWPLARWAKNWHLLLPWTVFSIYGLKPRAGLVGQVTV